MKTTRLPVETNRLSASARCFARSIILSLGFAVVGLASAAAASKPLKVFILAGQSNMQGHAKVSTFEHIGMDPATKPMLAEMLGADGKPKVCERVWISSIGCADAEQTGKLTAGFGSTTEKIGPEFTFGIYMEKFTDAPILLIKTSWGGKSLNTDFRSPSAGPYVFNETQLAAFQKQNKDVAAMKAEKAKATGVSYRLMVEHVKMVLGDIKRLVPGYDAAQGYELAGFAWFQGWNDMVDGSTYPQRDKPGGYDAYSTAMAHFIRDVRQDLNAPKLPFVIGVLGVGGPTSEYLPDQMRYKATHQNFRDAMAAGEGRRTQAAREEAGEGGQPEASGGKGGTGEIARGRADGARAAGDGEGHLQSRIPLSRLGENPRRRWEGPRRGNGGTQTTQNDKV